MNHYEIKMTANGATYFRAVERFPSVGHAVLWTREFAKDWGQEAHYAIWCREDEMLDEGRAN